MLMLRRVLLYSVLLVAMGVSVTSAQEVQVDIDSLGPQVGSSVPSFSGVDQFGRRQSLESVAGPEGAMLVFFRSADW
jgi:hypothetical protein